MIKKYIKDKLKYILIIGIISIICISGTAFAAFQYNAKQVEYKDGKSVEQALNELYNKNSNLIMIYSNSIEQYRNSTASISFDVEENKEYYIICYYSFSSGNIPYSGNCVKGTINNVTMSSGAEILEQKGVYIRVKGNENKTISLTMNTGQTNTTSHKGRLYLEIYQ